MGTVHVVVGGQFGSEAKGHITAQLVRRYKPSWVIRVAGPNAGHSAIHPDSGEKIALRQIPVAAVVDPDVGLGIAAGSEVDPDVLLSEIEMLHGHGIEVLHRLYVDPQATLINAGHRFVEKEMTARLGSTAKGIGAARADRIMRNANIWADVYTDYAGLSIPEGVTDINCVAIAEVAAASVSDVIIEGTQGYGLGLHAGHYPFCTSSDARAIDFLAMVGMSPWRAGREIRVWPVFRTYPIRVAGNSGPLLGELSWEELAERTGGYIQPERTTVTGNIRRVGEWDMALARKALAANGAPSERVSPVLTFFDYWYPELAGASKPADIVAREPWDRIWNLEQTLGTHFAAVTTGPDSIIWLGP